MAVSRIGGARLDVVVVAGESGRMGMSFLGGSKGARRIFLLT